MIKVYLSAFKAQNSKSPSLRAYLVHNFKHVFSFQTTLHAFPHTLSPTHISKKIENCCLNTRIKRALSILFGWSKTHLMKILFLVLFWRSKSMPRRVFFFFLENISLILTTGSWRKWYGPLIYYTYNILPTQTVFYLTY